MGHAWHGETTGGDSALFGNSAVDIARLEQRASNFATRAGGPTAFERLLDGHRQQLILHTGFKLEFTDEGPIVRVVRDKHMSSCHTFASLSAVCLVMLLVCLGCVCFCMTLRSVLCVFFFVCVVCVTCFHRLRLCLQRVCDNCLSVCVTR